VVCETIGLKGGDGSGGQDDIDFTVFLRMRHIAQRGKNVARRKSDVLLDALNACEEIAAVALLIEDAEPANIGWPAVQSAGRAIGRTADAAGLLVCELMDAEETRRQRSSRRGEAPREGPSTDGQPFTPQEA
jgi:hypothetical protein